MEKVKNAKISKGHQEMLKMARTVLAKVAPVVVSLTALLSKDEMPMVPVIVRRPLELCLERFSGFEENAKEVISSEGVVCTIVQDLKDFVEITKPQAEHRDE